MTNKLLLGSGDWHWPGWISLDANPEQQPDILAVVPPLPAWVMAQEWTEILASHFIEHLYRWDALALLKECYQVLLPGGILTLEQPNIWYCAEVLVGVRQPPEGRPYEQFSMWGLFGAPNGNSWDGHKWGYTPASLSKLIAEAGFDFRKITIGPGRYHEPERDFTLTAMKD